MAVPLKETKTVIARRQDLIRGTIRSIARRGFANSTVDTRRAALMYAQMIDGFSLGLIMDKDAYTPKEAAAIICDWLRSLFVGSSPASRQPAKALAR